MLLVELEPPDEGPSTAAVGQADRLARDVFGSRRSGDGVLAYSHRVLRARVGSGHGQVGLTHLSLSVSELGGATRRSGEIWRIDRRGTVTDQFAMVRDPDGQLLEAALGRVGSLSCRRARQRPRMQTI